VPISQGLFEFIHDLGQTHLKYKNPLIARVSAFLNLAYFSVKILIQQGFHKYRAFALIHDLKG
jgi:hypothetical protein